MHVIRNAALVAAAFGAALSETSCRRAEDPAVFVSTDPLVGSWTTDPTLTQLGTAVSSFEFRNDGKFSCSTDFKRSLIPTMNAAGTYVSDGKSIRTQINGKEDVATYVFEGEVLVLTLGRDVFRLKRK
jgi:hypothetical protein